MYRILYDIYTHQPSLYDKFNLWCIQQFIIDFDYDPSVTHITINTTYKASNTHISADSVYDETKSSRQIKMSADLDLSLAHQV